MTGDSSTALPVALVTGAGSGIGETIAWRLANRGYAVAVIDIDAGRSTRVASELTGAGCSAVGLCADVTQEESVAAAIRQVEDGLGPIAVLINNAGVADTPDPSVDAPLDAWQHVLDVNLRGVFACSRLAARGMISRGSGCIVNIASIIGLGGVPRRSAYGPSKAAVLNLTQTLASEWAPLGLRVNAVAPGFVRTPLFEKSVRRGMLDVARLQARIPARRLASVDDIAAAVAFLVSPEAAYINGAVLPVDGALTASLGVEI